VGSTEAHSMAQGMVGMALDKAEDSTLEDNMDHKDRSIHIQ